MIRRLALISIALTPAVFASCGPDQRECSGPHPDFVVILKLASRPLPPDTVVRVTYGGSGKEDYSLAAPGGDHEVVFCRLADADGVPLEAPSASAADAAGAAGDAAGAAGDDPGTVAALHCELWTAGFAKLDVSATGLPPSTYELSPRDHTCTVTQTLVLDSPDAG